LLGKYMIYSKTCYWPAGSPASQGCWYSGTKANPSFRVGVDSCAINFLQCYSGDNAVASGAILNDGTLIILNDDDMYVDVNGFKPPNSPGQDVFVFRYDYNSNKHVPLSLYGQDSRKPFIGN